MRHLIENNLIKFQNLIKTLFMCEVSNCLRTFLPLRAFIVCVWQIYFSRTDKFSSEGAQFSSFFPVVKIPFHLCRFLVVPVYTFDCVLSPKYDINFLKNCLKGSLKAFQIFDTAQIAKSEKHRKLFEKFQTSAKQ